MWSEPSSPAFLVVVAASIIAHGVVLAALPPAESATPATRPTTLVTIEVPPPPPPPPPPIETPTPPDTVRARPQITRAARSAVRRTAAPAPTKPAPETPVDFSGLTLSNEGGGWSSPTGNGDPVTGPIANPSPPAPAPARPGPAQHSSERVVAVGDLSRAPGAPNLDTALAANYPREARRAGTTGKAVVRARILSSGSVGTIRVVSESGPGFGTACKQTLAGSHWQPPLDANRQPVTTDVTYTCTFAIAR